MKPIAFEPGLHIVRPAQRDQWYAVLDCMQQSDVYFLPEYHTLEAQRSSSEALLYVYAEDEYLIALPVLVRAIACVPGLEIAGRGLYDATSVYGYAGPLASHAQLPVAVIERFQTALRQMFESQGIVAAFARLHPMIEQHTLLEGLGECQLIGPTVSIDLTLPEAEQLAQYRRNHRDNIRRLIKQGISCTIDDQLEYLDEFTAIYHETMQRVHALPEYFFSRDYFASLCRIKDVHLFICKFDNSVISAGIFTLCHNIVQFAFAGTQDKFLSLAPQKLMIDAVRVWGVEHGAHSLHLGGGVGAREDSLFHFKAGFSNRLHTFSVWRCLILPERYAELVQKHQHWLDSHGLAPAASAYFPVYRSPTRTAEPA